MSVIQLAGRATPHLRGYDTRDRKRAVFMPPSCFLSNSHTGQVILIQNSAVPSPCSVKSLILVGSATMEQRKTVQEERAAYYTTQLQTWIMCRATLIMTWSQAIKKMEKILQSVLLAWILIFYQNIFSVTPPVVMVFPFSDLPLSLNLSLFVSLSLYIYTHIYTHTYIYTFIHIFIIYVNKSQYIPYMYDKTYMHDLICNT